MGKKLKGADVQRQDMGTGSDPLVYSKPKEQNIKD